MKLMMLFANLKTDFLAELAVFQSQADFLS
jgi:hypothetical protein